MDQFSVTLVDWSSNQPTLNQIRYEVFVVGQGVPIEIEQDSNDAQNYHVLAKDLKENPIGTGRMLPNGVIGRMAVLQAYRNQGVGTRILLCLIEEAIRIGLPEVSLHSQMTACDFYEKQRFVCDGSVFEEAGIDHIEMKRKLI